MNHKNNDATVIGRAFLLRLGRSTDTALFSARQLAVVLSVPPVGGIDFADLARITRTPKPALSRAIEKLLVLGLVERAENPADRRRAHISLTSLGQSWVGANLVAA